MAELAESSGLLNRRGGLNRLREFESPPLRNAALKRVLSDQARFFLLSNAVLSRVSGYPQIQIKKLIEVHVVVYYAKVTIFLLEFCWRFFL